MVSFLLEKCLQKRNISLSVPLITGFLVQAVF